MKKRIRILAVYLLLLGFAGSAVYAAKPKKKDTGTEAQSTVKTEKKADKKTEKKSEKKSEVKTEAGTEAKTEST